ncbi:hypothetical protein L208DRAFT_1293915, partial [Tricholoma matsutake]
IWISDTVKWTGRFTAVSDYLQVLANGFNQVLQGELSLELARDSIRQVLHDDYPEMFPMGQTGISVGDLALKMLQSDNQVAESYLTCLQCNKTTEPKWDKKFGYKLDADSNTPPSTMKWLTKLESKTRKKCPDCSSKMVKKVSYTEIPSLLVLDYPDFDITTSHKIKLRSDSGESNILYLRGVVYHGQYHFTCRVITCEGNVWYHDGITTGIHCINDGHLKSLSNANLKSCHEKKLVLAIYSERSLICYNHHKQW